MSERLDDDDLLELLNRKEEEAGHYVWGELASKRDTSLREYYRMPYGNEQDGWSSVVTSDVSDTVEWILPALLKTFTSTDKAVSFEPTTAADVAGAEQATDACNYVFYKQNNGFLVLYTALKDALTIKNCAVMWRKETKDVVSSVPFKGATEEMLAMLLQEKGTEIQEAEASQVADEFGMPVLIYNGRLKKTESKTIIKVEAFNPDDLLIERDWTSPLLADCPYVARMMEVTLTDLKNMGFDVDADDLRSSGITGTKRDEKQLAEMAESDSDDDSMAEGWLRIEYVLADVDGDGIAERLCIYRLKDKILKKEVVSHVPVATFSPVLNTHQWDGQSLAEIVSDIQKLHTELIRQSLDNLKLTNNPRKNVLTDANGSPLANLDDLLDSRIGGIVRVRANDAVTDNIVPFTGGHTLPMLEYVKGMREDRTGVSRTSMGLNPDSLNNTATGRQLDQSAAMQRVELIARICAEILIKPIFQGILKLLTDGGMEKLAFRLRDEFVEYDPNEWRDSYDMTINVGLGTGDVQQKNQQLMMIAALQEKGMAVGLATPKHLYHTGAKLIENAGFKDIQNFIQDPSKEPPKPQQPPIEVQVAQIKIRADGQKHQAEMQADVQKFQAETQMTRETEQIKADAKLQEIRANLELQAANDARDSEREQYKAQIDAQLEAQKIEFERWKAELQAQTQIYLAQLSAGNAQPIDTGGDINNALAAAIEGIKATMETMNRPKTIIRGPDGRAQGIM